jgi:signal peptidase II
VTDDPVRGDARGADVRSKLAIFGVIFPVVIVLDWITKRWALDALSGGRRLDLANGLLPMTLAFNKGAAFGIRLGEDSRWFFVPVTLIALVLLGLLLLQSRKDDLLRLVALSLVVAGAVGNLYDRLRWGRGVVDFIGPVDLGFADFPIFNVADISITCGAMLLAISFWLEEREERRAAATHAEATAPPP